MHRMIEDADSGSSIRLEGNVTLAEGGGGRRGHCSARTHRAGPAPEQAAEGRAPLGTGEQHPPIGHRFGGALESLGVRPRSRTHSSKDPEEGPGSGIRGRRGGGSPARAAEAARGPGCRVQAEGGRRVGPAGRRFLRVNLPAYSSELGGRLASRGSSGGAASGAVCTGRGACERSPLRPARLDPGAEPMRCPGAE